MAQILRRPIVDALLERRDVPVLILEGARAVGKTTAVKHQLAGAAGYSYTTLADRSTLAFARHDLEGWLARLARPAVIDEAQLLPELPLAIKELVDAEAESANQFVLTGSASIGRTGLGGADPLARRSARLTMWPLTAQELAGQTGSLADWLLAGSPQSGSHPAATTAELITRMRYGGWPAYVLKRSRISAARLAERLAADTAAVLATTVDPLLHANAAIAIETLDALARTPGAIFNAARLAQLLGFDKRTIDRYMGVFQRLFMVRWLPNSATAPARQSHSRAKVHPVDTSLSVESLERAGVDLESSREAFGQVFESYVVSQVIASLGWARADVAASFWRDARERDAEVDLVLDARGGLRVGVEVKAASRVTPADLRGLIALRRSRGLDFGYVVHTGGELREVADRIWAVPVTALDAPGALA
ncbi:MAG: AAA family ATPase [Bifidobacteriaceae bacterium]|jgi:predicted AAA+ superfamily ATPase|nr:AAA family ATPase [Bifidobacteriaceae bacterium]